MDFGGLFLMEGASQARYMAENLGPASHKETKILKGLNV